MGLGGEGGDFFGGLAAGFGVGGEDIVDRGELGARRAGEDAFDDLGNAHEGQAILEEGRNGIEGARERATFFHGFAGEAETGEAARGSLLEIEALELGPVELNLLRRDARGVGERVLNGHAHVWRGELREHSAVDEFDEGMNDGLWVDDDVNLIGAHAEEPAGFNDFEAFVHHGGGVDGDAIAHFPVGMGESLIDGDAGEVVDGCFTEGAAGGGEDDAADFGVRSSGEWRVASGE